MKKIKLIISFAVGLAAVWSPAAMAWGPERPTYTMESPAPEVTFNSIINNPVLGDERDFVRIVESDTGGEFTNDVKVEPGKTYNVYIGYHNNAADNLNESGYGIAQRVRVASQFPEALEAGESGDVNVIIEYAYYPQGTTDLTYAKVWDGATLSADEKVKISFVPGSAIIHNGWGLDGTVLPDEIVTTAGDYIGLNELDGRIPGCSQYSGHIIYKITVEGEDKPENPPETPKELPKTGPAEIVMAVAVVAGFCGLSFYLYRTKRALKQVSDDVTGKNIESFKNDEQGEQKDGDEK